VYVIRQSCELPYAVRVRKNLAHSITGWQRRQRKTAASAIRYRKGHPDGGLSSFLDLVEIQQEMIYGDGQLPVGAFAVARSTPSISAPRSLPSLAAFFHVLPLAMR
jgi:hypothetical protein